MAGGKPKAEILLDLNISSALGGLNEFSDRLEVTMTKGKDSIRSLTKAWDVGVKVVGTISAAVSKWTAAAAEAEKVERQLTTAFKIRGDVTGLVAKSVQAYNMALERKLGIDADELAGIQQKLAAMGVDITQMKEATRATVGLATVAGSLDRASRLVARAYDGDTAALKRYNIIVDNAADAQDEFNKLFAVTESTADTVAVKYNVLEKNLENLEETLGGVVIQNEGLSKSLGTAGSIIDAVTPLFESLLELYLDIETGAVAAAAATAGFLRDNNFITWASDLLFVDEVFDDTAASLRNLAAAQEILAAAAPVKTQLDTLSNHPLVRNSGLGSTKDVISKGLGSGPGTRVGRGKGGGGGASERAEAILLEGEQLNAIDAEVFEQGFDAQKKRDAILLDYEKGISDFKLQLAQETAQRLVDQDERSLAHEWEVAQERRDILQRQMDDLATWSDFASFTTNTFATSMNGAIASLTESLVSGSGNVRSILFNLLSDILLQMGAFFSAQAATNWALVVPTEGGTLPQAIGYTAASVAAFAGAGALRGLANKGNKRASAAPAGGGGGSGFSGSAGVGGFSGLPSAPVGRGDQSGGPKTVIIHINKPLGSPARLRRELLEIYEGAG